MASIVYTAEGTSETVEQFKAPGPEPVVAQQPGTYQLQQGPQVAVPMQMAVMPQQMPNNMLLQTQVVGPGVPVPLNFRCAICAKILNKFTCMY